MILRGTLGELMKLVFIRFPRASYDGAADGFQEDVNIQTLPPEIQVRSWVEGFRFVASLTPMFRLITHVPAMVLINRGCGMLQVSGQLL